MPIYQVRLVRDGSQPAERKTLETAACAAEILHECLGGAEREHFVVLLLDTQRQVMGIHTVTVGTLDASLVHPREIFKAAILANACSILLAHDHPSGGPSPSPSAEAPSVTRLLVDAGVTLGIEVVDHVVLGDGLHHYSFREKGEIASAPAGNWSI